MTTKLNISRLAIMAIAVIFAVSVASAQELVSRKHGTVREQNNRVMQFPSNVVAGWFGFKKMEYFELSGEEEAAAPKGFPVA